MLDSGMRRLQNSDAQNLEEAEGNWLCDQAKKALAEAIEYLDEDEEGKQDKAANWGIEFESSIRGIFDGSSALASAAVVTAVASIVSLAI